MTASSNSSGKKAAVLFVCIHNAGRSQMAAGYLQHLAGDRILQAGITLQVKDPKDSEQLKLYMPQVKNRMLLLLSAKSIDELQSPNGKQTLATEIGASLKQPYAPELAPPVINGVYLTSFVIQ